MKPPFLACARQFLQYYSTQMAISEHKYIGEIIHQKCTRCNEWKPADEDHYCHSKQGKIGFTPYCRACLRETRQLYYARKYEDQKVRKKRSFPLSKDTLPIKKLPLQEVYKSFYEYIINGLSDQARYKAYLITCKSTSQHYVGITERHLQARWMQHLREVNKRSGYLLHEVINQYGIWDFEFKYIASAKTRNDLHELEKQLITQYDTVENGFNQTRGGATGESVGNPVTIAGKRFISLNAAARHYSVQEYAVHQRMKRYGYTLEEALEIEVRQKHPPKKNPFEVNGRVFPNFVEACRQYSLLDSVVRSRLEIGWSIRQAFGIDPPPRRGRNIAGRQITVDGETFPTIAAAACKYGIKGNVAILRLKYGWSHEQAFGLEPAPKPKPSGKKITVDGVGYESQSKAAAAYGLERLVVQNRINKLGWTIEQAFGLVPPPERMGTTGKQLEIEGVIYPSITKAAIAYNLDPKIVRKRMTKLGWSIEQALGLKLPSIKPNNFAKKVVIKGVTYESIKVACEANKISTSAVARRIKKGWSMEEAITIPSMKSIKVVPDK